MMGSIAYGATSDSSDIDIYGITIPPKEDIFPHLRGEIVGFGRQKKRFDQWQEHNITTQDDKKTYDFSVYSIIKFFNLAMKNNINILDSLFVPQRCIVYTTQVGNLIRENRKLFLHKGSYHSTKGYAYQQLHKMKTKKPTEGKRKEDVDKYGMDLKFAYHIVRLLGEAEQILIEGDLDLERNSEQLKSIRRGEWKFEEVENYFTTKERELETVYKTSKLQHSPDEKQIKNLLLKCLEHHYGSLDKMVAKETTGQEVLNAIQGVIDNFK